MTNSTIIRRGYVCWVYLGIHTDGISSIMADVTAIPDNRWATMVNEYIDKSRRVMTGCTVFIGILMDRVNSFAYSTGSNMIGDTIMTGSTVRGDSLMVEYGWCDGRRNCVANITVLKGW